jgi:hypothetical protein
MNLLLGFAIALAAGITSQPKLHLVQVELKQGDPFGSQAEGTISVIGRPFLVLADRQLGFVQISQSTTTADGVAHADSRHTVRVRAEMSKGGAVRIEGTVETAVVSVTGVANDTTRTTRQTRFRRDVFFGETVRVRIGRDGDCETWAEFTVSQVKHVVGIVRARLTPAVPRAVIVPASFVAPAPMPMPATEATQWPNFGRTIPPAK